MNEFYYEITEPCDIINSVQLFIPTATWIWAPFMTVASNFYVSVNGDTFLKSIVQEFYGQLKLYKFPAHSMYQWHKDREVGCSLNMVLENYDSHSFFLKDSDRPTLIDNIIELKYKPKTWYLFNSQKTHSVINLDNRDRILFTLVMPRHVKYIDVLNWYKKNG